MADTPLTIVGAGAVGLALAARLAPRFPELVVLERRERHGSETSSRNSEVIHAGMYYPAGSLKARLCVRGRELLYGSCERLGVPHRRITKLIVAPQRRRGGRARAAVRPRPHERRPARARDAGSLPRARAGDPRRGGAVLADDRHRERPRPDGRVPRRGTPRRRPPAGPRRADGPRAARPRLPPDDPHPGRHRVVHQRARGERGRPRVGHGGGACRASTWPRPATGSTGGRAATSRSRGRRRGSFPGSSTRCRPT